MPIIDVEGKKFDFPEGTPDAVIGEAIRTHFANIPQQAQAQTSDQVPRGQRAVEAGGRTALDARPLAPTRSESHDDQQGLQLP